MDQMLYRSWAEINLDKIAENVRVIRRHVSRGCEIMGVVKADAYGHGVREVVPVPTRVTHIVRILAFGLRFPERPTLLVPLVVNALVQTTVLSGQHGTTLEGTVATNDVAVTLVDLLDPFRGNGGLSEPLHFLPERFVAHPLRVVPTLLGDPLRFALGGLLSRHHSVLYCETSDPMSGVRSRVRNRTG